MMAVHIECIRELYAMMERVPSHRVYMLSWRKGSHDNKEFIKNCGSTACALGWSTLYPPFVQQKFKWDKVRDGPKYGGAIDFHAGAKFFGIEYCEAEKLFGPKGDKQVFLRNLRELMYVKGIISMERLKELERKAGAIKKKDDKIEASFDFVV